MKKKPVPPEPELSRPLRVEKISANGVEETIVAGENERRALAERFGLIAIERLDATLHVVSEQAGLNILVKGRVKADVVQRCVATLDPLPASVEQPVHVHFVAPELLAGGASERDPGEDDVEPIENGVIDLGELAAQHLGLALDPYPRKPDAPPVEAEFGAPAPRANPFARLVASKNRDKE